MQEQQVQPGGVHHILALSYTVYFSAIILGIVLEILAPREKILLYPELGFFLMLFGTILIYWAQHASRVTVDERRDPKKLSVKTFTNGPYKFFRSPTHIGMLFLTFGFAFIYGSVYVFVASFVAFLVTRFTLVRREESILLARYGDAYKEYLLNHPF